MSESRWFYRNWPLATWYIAFVLTLFIVLTLLGY